MRAAGGVGCCANRGIIRAAAGAGCCANRGTIRGAGGIGLWANPGTGCPAGFRTGGRIAHLGIGRATGFIGRCATSIGGRTGGANGLAARIGPRMGIGVARCAKPGVAEPLRIARMGIMRGGNMRCVRGAIYRWWGCIGRCIGGWPAHGAGP